MFRRITFWLLFAVAFLTPSLSFAEATTTGDLQSEMTSVAVQKTEKEQAVDWIMGFMIKNAPPGRKTYFVDAQETKEATLERYRSIAEDLIEVVYHPSNKSPFGGPYGRAQTASIMLGVMLYESGFGRHVDFGIGKYGRGDNGKSWCLLQINVGNGRIWANGWNLKENRPWTYGDKPEDRVLGASGLEMVTDRRLCFKEAMRAIRLSFGSCASRPFKERLNQYASGKCADGSKASRLRITTAMKFWGETSEIRKKFLDAKVQEQLLNELNQAVPVAKDPEDNATKTVLDERKLPTVVEIVAAEG